MAWLSESEIRNKLESLTKINQIQNLQHKLYITGKPDSASELIWFMKCIIITDFKKIKSKDFLIAATQAC